MPDKLNLRIDAEAFTGQDGAAFDARGTDGGLPSSRLDFSGMRGRIDVSWNLNSAQWATFLTFYNVTIAEGSLSFLLDVAFDYSTVQECEVKIIPGTLKASKFDGLSRVVSASLEIVPMFNASDDAAIIFYVETYGFEDAFFNAFEHLVLIDLPEDMHFP